MDTSTILPVVTLIFGWFLKEVETRFGSTRNLRRAMNRALAELLDLCSLIKTHENVVARHKLEAEFSHDSELRMRIKLAKLLMNSAEAMRNYDAAILEVASEDPVLGSELRALHRRLEQLTEIIDTVASAPEITPFLMHAVEMSVDSIRKNVEECAVNLAGRLGRATAKTTRHHLETAHVSSADDRKRLDELNALRLDVDMP